jgi:hypothetical protein
MLASKQGTTPPLHRAPLHCHNLALISVQQQQPKPVHLLSPPAQCALSLSLPPPALSISLCVSLPLSCAIIPLGSSSPLLSTLVLPLPSLLSLSSFSFPLLLAVCTTFRAPPSPTFSRNPALFYRFSVCRICPPSAFVCSFMIRLWLGPLWCLRLAADSSI